MKQKNKAIIFFVVLTGIIVPFFPYLTIIQMFFLLVPFAILFVATLVYLIASLFSRDINSQRALFLFSILPIFILSQLLSSFTVDKIQRVRSNSIISDIYKIKSDTGSLPKEYNLVLGIEYIKIKGEESFVLEYSRGFMVTEKYQSKYNTWRSYGWND